MSNPDTSEISDGYHTFGELYEHRHWLFISLMRAYPDLSWASRTHSDGSSIEGWFIAGMTLSTGQISYHMPDELWSVVEAIGLHQNKQPDWDGHTAAEALDRLREWTGSVKIKP